MHVRIMSMIVALCAMAGTAFAQNSNPPWFPSLMAFEHYDSERTKLFEHAHFAGELSGANMVDVRVSPDAYPTPYNVVYLSRRSLFVFGGAYGGDPGATGSFVARVDPESRSGKFMKDCRAVVA